MPEYLSPGVYVEEVETGAMPIEGVSTSTAGFLGETERGPTDPQFLTSFADYRRVFGGYDQYGGDGRLNGTYLAYAVEGFFQNGGTRCFVGRVTAETEVAETAFSPFGQRTSLGLSTDTLSFSDTVLGDETTETLTVTNTSGDRSVEVSSVNVDSGKHFGVDPLQEPVSIPPGGSHDLTVTFAPTAEEVPNDTLLLEHDADFPNPSPIEVTLAGSGVGRLSVSVADLAFRTVVAGGEDTREVTLSNRSETKNVVIESIDGPQDPFETDFTAPVTLEPNGKETFTVTFKPADASVPDPTTTLILTVDEASGKPVEIDVSGRVVEAVDGGDLTTHGSEPGTADFGAVAFGTTETLTVRVLNTEDSDPVTVGSVVIVPDTAEDGEFALAEDHSGFEIPEAGYRDFVVTFQPEETGSRTANLVLRDDAGADIEDFSLSGEGTEPAAAPPDPVVVVNTEYADFGLVPVDSRAYRTITVENRTPAGGKPVKITGGSFSPDANVFEIDHDFVADGSIDIAAGASERLVVVYEPTDETQTETDLELVMKLPDGSTENETISLVGMGNGTALTARAVGPGVWGRHVALVIDSASLASADNDLFKLTVRYWSRDADAAVALAHGGDTRHDDVPAPTVEEVYDNLSPSETSSEYYVNRLADASNLIELEPGLTGGRPANTAGGAAWLWTDAESVTAVTPGTFAGDENDPPGERTGFAGLAEVDQVSIVCVPDENEYESEGVLTDQIRTHCELLKDRIAVLQTPRQAGSVDDISPPVDSKYAAYYYPWLMVVDPLTNGKKAVPAGGHVAGVYARTDAERGVHKAPANVVLRGIIEPQAPLSKAEQDILNPRGVNCIRTFEGRGTRVWGARTTSSNPLWKYVNVRRLFLYIEESIDEGTQWSVFEPNDEPLWARVRQSVTNFLTTTWRDGALQGTTPDQAFFVTCDRTTMTQDDIDNGRLIVEIGVAPVKPAEFVVFRISQWTGGVSES